MKLSKTKRVPIGRTLELESSEPYDTLKAQILVQIASALNPPKIIQEDYNISFTIARAVSVPLALQSESDYNFLVKQATKGKNILIVKIACEQKATQVRESSFHSLVFHQLKSIRPTQIMGGEDKENDGIEDDDDELKKTKKKSNVSVCLRTVSLFVLMITFRSHESRRYFKETSIAIQIFNSFKSAGHAENVVVVPTVSLMRRRNMFR